MTDQQSAGFDHWCIVELFGHQQIAGRVTEHTIAGQAFVRVEVPETNGAPTFSKLYGPSAIYGISPVSEEICRLAVKRLKVDPLPVYIPELNLDEIRRIEQRLETALAETRGIGNAFRSVTSGQRPLTDRRAVIGDQGADFEIVE